MTVEAGGRDPLGAVRPDDVVAYLDSRGWRRLGDVRRAARWVWPTDEGLEVLVPLDPQLADFAARIRDLVHGLSLAEDRPPERVLRDLLSVYMDAIRVRVQPLGEQDGSIPIDDGVVLVQQARGMLVAAACSAVRPQAHHPRRPPDVVRSYVDGVRLGQTEQGSYVVTLVSPVDPGPAEAVRAGRLPIADPFPRQVITTLASALEAARETAERRIAGEVGLRAFLETVDQGVSANLCDSLARMSGRRQRGFSVGFGWAPILPASRPVTAIEFDDLSVQVLSQAAALLRAAGGGRLGVVQGQVVRLQRQRDQGPGRIAVEGAFQGERRRVAIDLDEGPYDLAILAHQRGLRITVEGRLVREGDQWLLAGPRNFRPIDPVPGM